MTFDTNVTLLLQDDAKEVCTDFVKHRLWNALLKEISKELDRTDKGETHIYGK